MCEDMYRIWNHSGKYSIIVQFFTYDFIVFKKNFSVPKTSSTEMIKKQTADDWSHSREDERNLEGLPQI